MTHEDIEFWEWAKRIGILAGAVIAVATIFGFMWHQATSPILVAISTEAHSRAVADSLILGEIHDLRRSVEDTNRLFSATAH